MSGLAATSLIVGLLLGAISALIWRRMRIERWQEEQGQREFESVDLPYLQDGSYHRAGGYDPFVALVPGWAERFLTCPIAELGRLVLADIAGCYLEMLGA